MLCELSYWAPELLGSVVIWHFLLPSLGKVRVALMRIYGEFERIARFPKRLVLTDQNAYTNLVAQLPKDYYLIPGKLHHKTC